MPNPVAKSKLNKVKVKCVFFKLDYKKKMQRLHCRFTSFNRGKLLKVIGLKKTMWLTFLRSMRKGEAK